MRRKLGNAVLYSAALAQLLFAAPAWAQSSGDDEIVVTAQRREQQLQDVPASVVAIGEQELERRNINELSDYLTTVPGMNYSFSQGPTGARGRQSVGIRGFTRFSGLTANTVGFYIDDTPIDVANPRILDLNRIEVLRGPQGTLYGAASMAGTIKLITNQPNPAEFEGQTSAEYFQLADGDAGSQLTQMLNIPLGDSAALRITGLHSSDAGWIDNYDRNHVRVAEDINSGEADEIRGSLLLQLSPGLSVTPSYYYHRLSYDSEPSFVARTSGAGLLPERSTQEFAPTSSDETFSLYGLNVRYDAGWADIVSQTSYYDFSGASYEDITSVFAARSDFLPVNIYSVTNEQTWVEEIRLASNLDGPLQFVGGVYYEDAARPFTSASVTPGLNAAMAGTAGSVLPSTPQGDNYFDVRSTRDQTQLAVFTEATWTLNPQWEITGGLRYFNFDSHSTDNFTGFLFLTLPAVGPGSASEDGVNPKVSVSYRPNEDILFYATAARGFRPGNANIPLPTTCNTSLINAGITPPGPNSFDSDSVWSYEAGARTEWFNGRLRANVTAFQMDWSDLQVVVRLPSCRISGYVVNAGDAQSRGVEFEFGGRPIDALDLSFSGTYLNAELVSPNAVLGSAASPIKAGTSLLDTPELTLAASAQYNFPLSASLEGYARADVRYRDETNLNFAGTLRTDAFTQLDLRFGVLGHNETHNWELALFVENATDEDPILSNDGGRSASITTLAPHPVVNYVLGGFNAISIQPRTIGLRLNLEY